MFLCFGFYSPLILFNAESPLLYYYMEKRTAIMSTLFLSVGQESFRHWPEHYQKRGRGLYNGEGLYNGGGLLGRCPELFWMEAVEKATEQSWLFFTWSARGRRVKI